VGRAQSANLEVDVTAWPFRPPPSPLPQSRGCCCPGVVSREREPTRDRGVVRLWGVSTSQLTLGRSPTRGGGWAHPGSRKARRCRAMELSRDWPAHVVQTGLGHSAALPRSMTCESSPKTWGGRTGWQSGWQLRGRIWGDLSVAQKQVKPRETARKLGFSSISRGFQCPH